MLRSVETATLHYRNRYIKQRAGYRLQTTEYRIQTEFRNSDDDYSVRHLCMYVPVCMYFMRFVAHYVLTVSPRRGDCRWH